MHPKLANHVARFSLPWLGSTSILFALVVSVAGQRPPNPPSSNPNDPINQERTNRADLHNREWLLENNRKLVRKPGLGPSQSVAPEIKEDFERIQFINREMIKAVFIDHVVDNQQILKAVGEIKKRAARLKANLAYPEPPATQNASAVAVQGDTDIKVLLAGLDKSIMSFVTNPIFQLRQQVVATDLAMKASGDLLEVMENGDKIRKMLKSSDKH